MVELFSTYRDIIDLIPQLYESDEDTADSIAVNSVYPLVNPNRMRNFILKADGRIKAVLKEVYGNDLTIIPFYTIPEANYNNSGSGDLAYTDTAGTGLKLTTTCETQVWRFRFTDSTNFDCISSIWGSQGSGDTSSTFTSSNSKLILLSGLWSGTPATGDRFEIRTYNVNSILTQISSMLASYLILNSIYTENIPNSLDTADEYKKQAEDLLKDLRIQKIFLPDKGISEIDLDPVQVDYEVSDEGEDLTNYRDDEWNRRSLV